MSVADGIPFLDLVTPHLELEKELTEVFHQALHNAGFVGGPMVEQFEEIFRGVLPHRLRHCGQ